MGKKSRRKGGNKSSSNSNVHVHHKQGEGTHGHHKYHSGSVYLSHHKHSNGNNGGDETTKVNVDENADKNITTPSDQESPKQEETGAAVPVVISPAEDNDDGTKDPLNESETEIVFEDAKSVDSSGLDGVFHLGDVENTPNSTPAVVSQDEDDESNRNGVALAPLLVLPATNAEGDETAPNVENGPISPDVQNDELFGKQGDSAPPADAAAVATTAEEAKEEITTGEEQKTDTEGFEVLAATEDQVDEVTNPEEGATNVIVDVDDPQETTTEGGKPDPEQVIDVDSGKPDEKVERRVSFATVSRQEQPSTNKSREGALGFLGALRDNARNQVSNKEEGHKKTGRLTTCKILFLVLAAWALAMMIYLLVRDNDDDDNDSSGQGTGSSSFSDPQLDPIYMIPQDPYNGETDLADTNPWPSNGNGVSIPVLNALQPGSEWTPIYNSALTSWNRGNPRSLRLTSGKVNYDPSCVPVEGYVKVCNDDYGPNGWRGINDVVTRDGFLTSSVVKINEFYLADRSDDEKEYVFCHQLGHSWGLVHGNEDFNDEDTQSCMDYTYNYGTHKGPNERDFNVLRFLYGVFPAQNGQRSLRGKAANENRQFTKIDNKLESWVANEINSLYNRREGRRLNSRRWRRLHSDANRESYEVDLGKGYKLQIHGLLA